MGDREFWGLARGVRHLSKAVGVKQPVTIRSERVSVVTVMRVRAGHPGGGRKTQFAAARRQRRCRGWDCAQRLATVLPCGALGGWRTRGFILVAFGGRAPQSGGGFSCCQVVVPAKIGCGESLVCVVIVAVAVHRHFSVVSSIRLQFNGSGVHAQLTAMSETRLSWSSRAMPVAFGSSMGSPSTRNR